MVEVLRSLLELYLFMNVVSYAGSLSTLTVGVLIIVLLDTH